MQIETSKLDDSIVLIMKSFNENVLETFRNIAQVIKEERDNGDNAVMDQAYDQCKKTLGVYNPCVESTRKFVEDVKATMDVAEYLEKMADMESAGSHDASFATQNLDSSSVVI